MRGSLLLVAGALCALPTAGRGAGLDCRKGRYEQGIRDLEKVLCSQGYTVPPPG